MSELTPSRISRSPVGDPAIPARRQPVRNGDIRRIEPIFGIDAEPRDALIVRTDSHVSDFSEIILTHTLVDMATPDDIIICTDDPAYEHGLVVQTHHRGVVWNLQVTTLLGHMTAELMSQISSVMLSSTPISPDLSNGRPFSEGYDSRREFQESELQALWALTGDCTDAMLDDGPPWQIDDGLLSPRQLSRSTLPERLLTEVMHILRTREVSATPETMRSLEACRAFDADAWKDTPYGRGLASQIALSARSLIESAMSRDPTTDTTDPAKLPRIVVPNRASGAGEVHVHLGDRLVTSPSLWTDGGVQLLTQTDDDGTGGVDNLEVMMLATTGDSNRTEESPHNV